MSLIKWNSGELFPKTDTFWDDLMIKDFFNNSMDLGTTIPAVNSKETDSSYELEVAIPGLKKEDIHVEFDRGILTISSEKKEEKEEKDGEKVTRKEFNYSSFQRSFHLPENILEDQIEADYTDGILKLSLPKQTETKVHRKKEIEIH